MPFPTSKTTYVRPLRENQDDNFISHGTFSSSLSNKMQLLDASVNSNVIGLNAEINLKNMDETKTLYLENLNSIHSKLFAGVEEIQKWKTSVEMESKQKNKKVEQLLQTLEVQRKTILDLQLQNENVSYQLSEEIQQRSFVMENLHSTKELCSALKKHYNTLQGHFEYRNKIEDAFNLTDAKRLAAIENLQTRFEKVCHEHSEKVRYLNDTLASETNKALNLKETLEQQITIFDNEKESLCRMIENQQSEVNRISTEIDTERNKSKLMAEEKNALKYKVQELEGLIEIHSSNLKGTQEMLRVTQDEKLCLEKELLTFKTKIDNYEMKLEHGLEAAQLQEKESEEKILALYETISSLEDKLHSIEAEMMEEKQRNELLTSTISVLQNEKHNLEEMMSETKDELSAYEQLKNAYRVLEQQTSEFSEKERQFTISLEELNEKLIHFKSERESESEIHDEREEQLKKICEDYQNKLVVAEEKLKSLEESNGELIHKVKRLEEDLKLKADEVIVQENKILHLDSIINTSDEQLETLKLENISLKDKIESEKFTVCLECEHFANKLKEMENLKLSFQKVKEELQKQKEESKEIVKMLNDTETSYNDDRIFKEKEIIKFQEQVRRLEDELRMMNVKVEDFNTLKTISQKQRDEIEELKLSANKREEELNELKTEKEKLKEEIENLKNLTVREETLIENKEDLNESRKVKDQNKLYEENKSKALKVSPERKKRKIESRSQSRNRSSKKESVFSGLTKIKSGKKDTGKVIPKLPKDYDTDSTSSDQPVFEKNITETPAKNNVDNADVFTHPDSHLIKNTSKVPEAIIKDNPEVMMHHDSYSKKNEKFSSPYLDKNKWEVDSSGSEYLELTFDKDSEKITGLTPQRSPASSIKLISSTKNKSVAFNSRLSIQGKRDSQNVNSDNQAKKFGLPLKKNKSDLGNSMWLQPLRTPDRNADFWSAKENVQRSTQAYQTPSTPTDKKRVFGNTLTPSGQRKFFKTPLSDRDNKFKKPITQSAWSDFLKSSK